MVVSNAKGSCGATIFASYALAYDNGANTVGNLTGVPTDKDGRKTAGPQPWA